MLRNIVSFIFIYIFIISCDNSILGTQECSDCVLELSFTDLEIESDGYYHLDFNQDYIQTFTRIDAQVGNDYEFVGNDGEMGVTPEAFTLSQNFPNPFNPITHIKYDVNMAGLVTMDLFDIRGSKVKSLINESKTVGSHEFAFDGSSISSGVYFYSMTVNGVTQTRKLVLMK